MDRLSHGRVAIRPNNEGIRSLGAGKLWGVPARFHRCAIRRDFLLLVVLAA
jgi:hypothetical protein